MTATDTRLYGNALVPGQAEQKLFKKHHFSLIVDFGGIFGFRIILQSTHCCYVPLLLYQEKEIVNVKALKSSVYISNACHLGPLSFIIFVLTLLNDSIYVHPNRNIILERLQKYKNILLVL